MRRGRSEIEQRRIGQLLARLGRRVPTPPEHELRALARTAAESQRGPATEPARRRPWRPLHLRWGVAVAVALLVGSGFGFGVGSRSGEDGAAGTRVVGFGFLPSKGWNVVQSGTVGATGTAHAVAANVSLSADDPASDLPYETLRRLPSNGAVIVAELSPRGAKERDSFFTPRRAPLHLAEATPDRLPDALAATKVVALRLRSGVSGHNIDVRIFLGAPPSPEMSASVDEQLRRLIVAPSAVSLVVQPTIIRSTSDRMTIFGSVSSGEAGKKVTIQFKACGLQPSQFRDAFETTTGEGGGFSLEELRPFNLGVSGVYRAVSGGEVSAEIRVQQRVAVYMRPLGGGRFQVWVGGKVSFWRRFVLLQRFERRRGVWITMRRLALTESFAQGYSARFRPRVPNGTQLRAVMPLSQARPCYLEGYGPIFRT